MGFLGISLHQLGIECCWINVHIGAGLHQIANEKTDHQRKCGNRDEVEHRLAKDAANLIHMAH